MAWRTPQQLLRVAGLIALILMAIYFAFDHLYGDEPSMGSLAEWCVTHKVWSSRQAVLFDFGLFPLYAWTFWHVTAPQRLDQPDRASRYLLALQGLIGLIEPVETSLLTIAVAPFVLPAWPALGFTALQSIGSIGIAVLLGNAPPGVSLAAPVRPFWATILEVMQWLVAVSTWNFVAFCLGLVAATEAQRRRELSLVNAELRALQALQADSVRVAERLRISRELHDTAGHHLAALSVNLQLANKLADGAVLGPLHDCHLVAKVLLSEMRDVVETLRDERAVDLRNALAIMVQGIQRPSIHLKVSDRLTDTEPLPANALFRCAQELVTNSIRHSGAQNLWIRLWDEAGAWRLEANDDGRGSAELSPGNGLRGMRERVEELGGSMIISTSRNAGFGVLIAIPQSTGAGL